jgi:hypothetical protein
MKRTILLLTMGALLVSGCARVFPMTHHASTPKQPASHVTTKAAPHSAAPLPIAPSSAPSKTTPAHKS